MGGGETSNLQQWVCRVCGYTYDPRLHEGVAFEDLSADWRCPGCGFGKEVFVPRARKRPPEQV